MNYYRIKEIYDFDETIALFSDEEAPDPDHEFYLEETEPNRYKRCLIGVVDWTARVRYNGSMSVLMYEKMLKSGAIRELTEDERAKLMLMDMGLR